MEGSLSQNKKGMNLLHETINRRLDQTLKASRKGRMSMLGTTMEALPLSFTTGFLKKSHAIFIYFRIG